MITRHVEPWSVKDEERGQFDGRRREARPLAPVDKHDPIVGDAQVGKPQVAVHERLLALAELFRK